MASVIDLTGMVFGKLKVLSIVEKRNLQGEILWLCECECGVIKEIIGSNLKKKNKPTLSCGCVRIYVRKDLTGKHFGRLTALKLTGKKGNQYLWLCNCECGNTAIVSSECLLGEKTKSCGCLLKEIARKRFIDLTGMRFGILTVLSYQGKTKDNRSYWLCKCDCGEMTYGNGHNLSSGNKVSCGCMSESFVAHQLKKYCHEKYGAKKEYKIIKNPFTGKFLFYDIYIPMYDLYVEVNGVQHYEYNKKWHDNIETFNRNKKIDEIKKAYGLENGFFIEIDLRNIKTINSAIDVLEEKIRLIQSYYL